MTTLSIREVARLGRAAMMLVLVTAASLPAAAQTSQRKVSGGFLSTGDRQAEIEYSKLAYCSDLDSRGMVAEDIGGPPVWNSRDVGSACQGGSCSGGGLGCGSSCGDDCSAGCCDLTDGCCEVVCFEPWMHRDRAFIELLYLHPVGADMHHAQQQNGTGGAGTTPFGLIGVADPHAEGGVRLGASCAIGPCSSVGVAYTFFESDSVDQLVPPSNVGGGLGTVGSLVHHPNAVITSSAGPVDAQYGIDMQLFDAEYRRLFRASNCGWLNYMVGARYGRLEQNFRQFGNFGGSQGGVIDTETEIDFDGGGLRLGIDGERILGCSCLSVYGNTSVDALFGSFRGDYRMSNATSVSDLAIVRYEDDRVTPMFEYELGLAWTSCTGCCRATLGYTGIHWFNVLTTPEFVDAVQADNYVDVGDTLSFHGLTTRFEFRY